MINRMHIVNCGIIFNNKKNSSRNLFFLMSKSHITPGKLIATGNIVPELHYSPYLYDWWESDKVVALISTSAAITSIYQSVFSSKTKYAELSYLGLDQSKTAQKLLEARQEYFSHQLSKYILLNWNNKIIMKKLYELYLKRNIRRLVEWCQERKLRTWHIMLHVIGCMNITPHNKDVSCCEFWTNAPNPKKDHETIAKLYEERLLNITSPISVFWNCFHNNYNANSKGIDGKPVIIHSKISEVKEKEF
ncbi:hypothetical protein C1645_882576 [Glomus cerebriforme]|uniref:Uncharacterized protein n=1 Tax=Glomus cerebriforme TaxID=658196 RepID=A0A397S5P8_9GLOM|nr:hypothetical protein C1645_882576 [Glomus cerebriforme]